MVFDLTKEETKMVSLSELSGREVDKDQQVVAWKKGEIILERTFNFKIRDLVTDAKDKAFGNPSTLMLVT